MRLRGHLVEIDWDGSVLAARGTNAEGREFLASHTDDGRLELTVDQIDDVAFRDAPRMIGGLLLVVDTEGHEHRMHFRRVSRDAFHQVYDELQAAVASHRAEHPVVDLTEPVVEAESTQGAEYDASVSV
jgi:hypothetical protein